MATEYSLLTWLGKTPQTITFTDAGDIVNLAAHAARTGMALQFPDNGGNALPTGLSKNTTYYLREGADANKFILHPTKADALANTNQVTFTGTGSGTHKVIGAYWATLDTAGRARYGTAGSERVYSNLGTTGSGLAAPTYWMSTQFAATDLAKDVVLEIQGSWVDSSYNNTFLRGFKSITITTKINGVRNSESYHYGRIGGGWANVSTAGNDTFAPYQPDITFDGLELRNTGASANIGAIRHNSPNLCPNNRIINCILQSYWGILWPGPGCQILNNIIIDCRAEGIRPYIQVQGVVIAYNMVHNCVIGMASTSNNASEPKNELYVGNIATGCSTSNWQRWDRTAAATCRFRAYNNYGESSDVITVTFDATNNLVNYTSHGFSKNVPLKFVNSGGTLPGGISANATYYTRTVSNANAFTLTTTIDGGADVDITSAGSGTTTISLVYDTSATGSALSAGTVASTDFSDYANNYFYPAATSSPQVNVVAAGIDSAIPDYDVAGLYRPDYESASFPTNLSDAGPFEYDHGEGNTPPIIVTFSGLVAGSTVRVFPTGTQTVTASTTNSGTTYSPAGVSATTYDYTIYQDGYAPIRATGVDFSDGLTINVTPVVDRAFAASSGLSYGTTATVNTSTKVFTIGAATTGQNWYSFWIEQYRQQADLYNKAFPLQPNGPNSFTCLDDYEIDAGDFTYITRDGIRFVDTSGTLTAAWAAILTVGVSSGMRVRYQQADGGTTQQATNTSGNMDELIKIYGDASHGNIDYRGYLVLKVQEQGYDQAEADAVALYGNLEDQLYVVGLSPTANGVATGDPGITGVTITDHAGSPVTWNSKDFSITIEDTGDNTGTNIMKWLRYNFETGGAFQSKDGFNWHDLVQTNGSKFKGVRGKLYGDTGATLKGVRVIDENGDSHRDFDLHTADDGTTYAPPLPPAEAAATVLAGSRVQLYNVTQDAEIDNVSVAGTSYSYIITTEADLGDTLRLRVCKLGYEPAESVAVWSSVGATFLVTQTADAVYAAWGIDGSAVTEFALDVTGNIEIDANDVDGSTTKTRLGAWYNYALTTEDGIRYAYGAITPLATNAIRINVDVVDLTVENTNALTALRFTDTDVRLYRSDGTSIIATTSYSIHNDYSGVPDVVETGVSGLTASESNQLFAIPTTSTGLSPTQDAQLMATLTKAQFIGLS